MLRSIFIGSGLCLLAAHSNTTVVADGGAPAQPHIVNGVLVDGAAPPAAPAPALPDPAASPAAVGTVVLNFDDVVAPCLFFDTQPLRTEYAAFGVVFRGRKHADGGAILDECSNFSVTGYSPPNFLAFNTGVTYAGGGFATPPELAHFSFLVRHVEVRVGSGEFGQTFTLHAVDASGAIVTSSTISLTPALQTVGVSGSGIVRVIMTCTASAFVVDDLLAF